MLGGYEIDTSPTQKNVSYVISAFDRILDVFEKLYNLASKGTFDSTRAIFERARQGALADVIGFEDATGGIAAGSGFEMMDPVSGRWRTESAWNEPIPGKGGSAMQMPAVSQGSLVDELADAIGDPDPRTGLPKGLSRAATKELLNGQPARALAESTQLAEARVADLNARIEAVKQRAAMEGC
jgi:hypothetical protein